MATLELDTYLTVAELARETGYSWTWVARVMESNGVRPVRCKRRTLISPDDADLLRPKLPPRPTE